MTRAPDPLRDVRSLVRAVFLLVRLRPRATHVGTPKAGLIIGVASAVSRVPVRMYTVHGLRFETTVGWRRRLFMSLERLSCSVATKVVAVSPSVATELVRHRLVRPSKVMVLGAGSISGVDLERFGHDAEAGADLRRQYGIDPAAPVVTFVGRLSADKGLQELAEAWQVVSARRADAVLLIVGDVDRTQPATRSLIDRLGGSPGVRSVGELSDVAPVYSATDVLTLPSYREGFSTVILEAAAAGVPAVTTDATGCRDAVVDGHTGLVVPTRDAAALADAMLRLIGDAQIRMRLGAAARSRAERDFAQQDVAARMVSELVS